MHVSELERFLARNAEDVAEAAWMAALGQLERAVRLAREGVDGRFRSHPPGELRRLRREVAVAMGLARLAAAVQKAENDRWRELEREARELAAARARAARRARTLPAELQRLANAASRKAETEVVAPDPSC